MYFVNSWTDRLIDTLAEIIREIKDKFKKPELKPIPVKDKD